ncbi:MAG: hypothetical protein HXX11_14650 [Desulfuromonadales bacterium]|nr:hypothetical protein [Desulfuromonadales bacterium]
MATMVQENESTARIRVALVIESGKLKPVWFEEAGKLSRERIFIKEICYTWVHMDGAAKIISFSVWDGSNSYRLSLNTRDFTWKLGVVESSFR